MRKATLPLLVSMWLCVPPTVPAQEADHTDRGDVSDFREHEDGQPEPYEYGPDGAPQPSWTISTSLPLLADTNPFWSSDGSEVALLAAPSLALTYSHPQLVPGWDLELRTGAAADFFSHEPDDLNEARLDASARLFHQLGDAGTLSFGFKARWNYLGKDFGDFGHAQQRYSVAFAPNISDDVWASVSAEYRDASQDSDKRFIGTVNLDWTMIQNEHLRLGFFQELAYSRFNAGANDGRRDLLSLSELLLSPNLDVPEGMRLGIATTLFHRFSNRESSRFTALQVGPSFGFSF